MASPRPASTPSPARTSRRRSRRAGALGREHDAVAVAARARGAGARARRRRRRPDRTRSRRRAACRGCRASRAATSRRPGVREQPVERRARAAGASRSPRAPHVAASVAASDGLLVEQLLRAVAHALRLDEQHERVVGQEVGEQVLAVGEPRQPRLHAVERLALGEPLPLLAAPRLRARAAPRRARAPRRSGSSSRAGKIHASATSCVRALVGDRERREPVDLVAPEVDAHGMVVGRRVHVDDRAAHRDLAARLDLVLAPVAHRRRAGRRARRGRRGRPARTTIGSTSSTCGPSRCTSARTGATTTVGQVLAAGAQPPHHAQAPAHRLERRRHPLERQRLPRREELDRRRRRGTAPGRREALGLGAGRHREHERPAGRRRRRAPRRTAPGPASGTATVGSPADRPRASAGSSARSGASAASGGRFGHGARSDRGTRTEDPDVSAPGVAHARAIHCATVTQIGRRTVS